MLIATFRRGDLAAIERLHCSVQGCGLGVERVDLGVWRADLGPVDPKRLERYRQQAARESGLSNLAQGHEKGLI